MERRRARARRGRSWRVETDACGDEGALGEGGCVRRWACVGRLQRAILSTSRTMTDSTRLASTRPRSLVHNPDIRHPRTDPAHASPQRGVPLAFLLSHRAGRSEQNQNQNQKKNICEGGHSRVDYAALHQRRGRRYMTGRGKPDGRRVGEGVREAKDANGCVYSSPYVRTYVHACKVSKCGRPHSST